MPLQKSRTAGQSAGAVTTPVMPPVIDPNNLYSEATSEKLSPTATGALARVYVPNGIRQERYRMEEDATSRGIHRDAEVPWKASVLALHRPAPTPDANRMLVSNIQPSIGFLLNGRVQL